MKPLRYLLFGAAILFACACNKDNIGNTSSVLTGTWKLRAVYYSIAGPLIKETGIDTSQYVQFNTDGTLRGNAYPGVQRYFLIDSTKVSLVQSNNNTVVYYYNVKRDTLTLGNAGCIEGCEVRFVKK